MGGPCIDPIFGPTVASFYWTSLTPVEEPTGAFWVAFQEGLVFGDQKTASWYVRAVRTIR